VAQKLHCLSRRLHWNGRVSATAIPSLAKRDATVILLVAFAHVLSSAGLLVAVARGVWGLYLVVVLTIGIVAARAIGYEAQRTARLA
jgi:hypothetical protein